MVEIPKVQGAFFCRTSSKATYGQSLDLLVEFGPVKPQDKHNGGQNAATAMFGRAEADACLSKRLAPYARLRGICHTPILGP